MNIVITRYDEVNQFLIDCFEGLKLQTDKKFQVLFLDQKNDEEIQSIVELYDFVKYEKIPLRSLSYARNLWIQKSQHDIIAFLDCDAIPAKNWVKEIKFMFSKHSNIWVVWTRILPIWLLPPKTIHLSSIVLEQYSLLDLWQRIKVVNKVVWASFAIAKTRLSWLAYFDESLGRKNWKLLWWEETDLCERILYEWFQVMYTWKTFVYHQIQKQRVCLYRALKRIYWWWYNRAKRWWIPSSHHKYRNIYDYIFLPLIILFYGFWYLKWKFEN